jgi:prepilin-type N-terminal cleavage/methylation domain-containing protein
MKFQKGFTLIELLVVIAIIGILSSVVLASLNSARKKGQEAIIKSNFKSMITQAELVYDTSGNYSTLSSDSKLTDMLTAITGAGGSSSFYSHNDPASSDINLRWGASVIMDMSTKIKKVYSITPTGIVNWDTENVNTAGGFVGNIGIYMDQMTWYDANNACAIAGGRLPILEELKTISDVIWSTSENTTHTPFGFTAENYWSSTTVPSNTDNAYLFNMDSGELNGTIKTFGNVYVRCVR